MARLEEQKKISLTITPDREKLVNRVFEKIGVLDDKDYDNTEAFFMIFEHIDRKKEIVKEVENENDKKEISSLQQKLNLLNLKASQLEKIIEDQKQELLQTQSKRIPDGSILIKPSEFTKGLLNGYLRNKGFLNGLRKISKDEIIKIIPITEENTFEQNAAALLVNCFVYGALGYEMETIYSEEKINSIYRKAGKCLI